MRRLLVPLDGSAFAESALPYAVTVAQGPTPCAIDLVGVDVPEPLAIVVTGRPTCPSWGSPTPRPCAGGATA